MTIHRASLGPVGITGVLCLVLLPARDAQAQVKLEYKYPEGRKLTYKTTSKVRQNLTLMGMGIEREETRAVVLSRTVGKRRADATLPVEQKVESIHVDMSFPGGKLIFDSNEPTFRVDYRELAFLGDELKLESQSALTFVLDEQYKVKAVEGIEKLLEKADKLKPEAKDEIRSVLEPEKVKRRYVQEHANLPDVLARPGEPWERTEALDFGDQTFTLRKKYEYVGTEKKGDTILDKITCKAIAVEYKQDPDTKSGLKVMKSDLKIESSSATILFDREEGCVVSSREKARLKGSMTFAAKGQEATGEVGEVDLNFEFDRQLQPPAK
jgi:hypothetical protein